MSEISYYLPTKIFFGQGVFKKLPEVLGGDTKKVFVVLDKYFLEQGRGEEIKQMLPDKEIEIFGNISPNPSIEQIQEVRDLIKDFQPDTVIALGGGSTIDTAKSASILSTQQGLIMDFLTKKFTLQKRQVDLIAIPTTAGTGSEVSPFATVWQGKEKYSLSGPFIFPEVALCDPELTLTMPPLLTASTGIDALSQAIEAYWSIYSTPLTDVYAQSAIELINNNLEKAFQEPDNIFYRQQMMLASLKAGMAFSQTKTTAVHAVSYPITAYFNIPHGLACGLILPAFLEYNYQVTGGECNDQRGVNFVKQRIEQITQLLGANTVEQASSRIKDLMEKINLPINLTKAGVNDIEVIVKHGFNPARVNNGPRLVTEDGLRQLLETLI